MDIKPFRGYRYNASTVGDPGLCMSPPYDVIDPDQQDELYQRSDYNFVRIIKGKKQADDNEQNNVYTRAAEHLKSFIENEILIQDAEDCLYVYAQDFTIGGQTYCRSGFIGLGKLETYGGGIRPHEQTLAGPKADRLNLTRATQSQTGQIFMLYSDPERTVDALLTKACEQEALVNYTDDENVTHRLYKLDNADDIATVQAVMKERDVFIADGHHRYETALNYYNETQNPTAAYCMMTFVNTHNEGLVVLPTHRLVHDVKDFSLPQFLGELQESFDVARLEFGDVVAKTEKRKEMLAALAMEFENGEHAFGMYFNDDAFYVATLRDKELMAQVASDHSHAWQKLDVSILHKLILEKLLGIDKAALTAQSNVQYIKDIGQASINAIDVVDEGKAQGLFFMNTTRIEQVHEVAAAGEKMPQKSTFFYPKIFSGLVLNRLV